MHPIPIFLCVGSKLEWGDLNREYLESVRIAGQRPDLKALEAGLRSWFDKNAGAAGAGK